MTLLQPIRSNLKIPRRGWYVFAWDFVMAALAFVGSLYLRVGESIFSYFPPPLLAQATAVFAALASMVFLMTGLYRGVWRYATVDDMIAVAKAATITVLLFLAVMFLWTRLDAMPRSVPFITWFVLIALLGGPRFLYRAFKDRRLEFKLEAEAGRKILVLLVGTSHGAELFLRAMRRETQRSYKVVGLVAEKAKRVGQEIHGVPVLGTLDDIPDIVAGLAARGRRPERLIVTKDDMEPAKIRTLLEVATAQGMTLARIPSLTEFKTGVAERMEVKPVALEDLLGRPQTPLDRESMRALIAGRRVLVTGAGGSIGSELVRQIAGYGPAGLILVDNSEFNLFSIETEIAGRRPALDAPAVIADVRDRRRIEHLFRQYRPELVFHAAALKHVPLVEANPFEGIATNVIGTVNVADACTETGVDAMVLISTDKAVNPTSIMGASKRIAEIYCQAMDHRRRRTGSGTRFVTVRFGNVLGSTGSVVPLFQKQLAAGGPLTVTHPDMKRYFMTVREAVELVLQASALGPGGVEDEGRIYVLDMGEPIRIVDLARQMIRLAGLKPDADIEIAYVGLRPGEKLSEDTFHAGETLVPTPCPGILLAVARDTDPGELNRTIRSLAKACADADPVRLTGLVHRLVPEYRSSESPTSRAAVG